MKDKIRGNLKSKTVWFNLATAVAGVTAVLAANPAMLAAYGPHAIVAVAVVNVLLRNVTTKPVEDK
jgi:uncharacterized membrane protein YdfJ with MMPL/SSD domain